MPNRLKVLEALAEAGISVGVMVASILPGLTDDESNLHEVVRAASDYGAAFVSGGVLRMCDGARCTSAGSRLARRLRLG